MDPEKLEQVKQWIEKQAWVFAKTMPDNPHEYVARNRAVGGDTDIDFDFVVITIRANGYRKMFRGRAYVCFDVGPYRYWTMGAPIAKTTIINRAVNDNPNVVYGKHGSDYRDAPAPKMLEPDEGPKPKP